MFILKKYGKIFLADYYDDTVSTSVVTRHIFVLLNWYGRLNNEPKFLKKGLSKDFRPEREVYFKPI